MAQATTKQWQVTRMDQGFDGLEFKEAPIPILTANEVLVKLHAVSLNYRDLMIPKARSIQIPGTIMYLPLTTVTRENTHSHWKYQ